MKKTTDLELITDLFIKRKKDLRLEVGNLQLDDVNEESVFNKTIDRFKDKYLLKPVVIGDPEIKNHRAIRKNFPPSYQDPMGGEREVYEIIVAFPFTGSAELFDVNPENVRVSFGRVYTPVGNTITVDAIELNALDKPKTLAEAHDKISVTKEIIKENNIQAKRWNEVMATQIEQLLNEQRKQLIDFHS
jgi:hypothetical protein